MGPTPNPRPENSTASARIVVMHDVQPEIVHWLWFGRIPSGKLTLIEGDPGVAKSWLTLAIATSLSVGAALPGDTAPRSPGSSLFLTAEDGLGDTLRPRLDAMGADTRRIHVLASVAERSGKERPLSLATDVAVLEQLLTAGPYRLAVLDPINAYLGTDLDANQDTQIRAILMPLAALAERTGVAIVGVRHLRKSAADRGIYRGLGSIGYTASARTVLLVGLDPQQPKRRVVVPIKNNLAPLAPAMAFELEGGKFLWVGESAITAASLLAPDVPDEHHGVRDEAIDFLRALLADGAVAAREAERQAKAAGISPRTLRRARRELGVQLRKVGYQGEWQWSLKGGQPDSSVGRPPFSGEYKSAKDGHDSVYAEDGHLWHGNGSTGPSLQDEASFTDLATVGAPIDEGEE